MAGMLLAAGQAEEALRWLPEETESYAVKRLRDALLWSEAHLRVGRHSEAQEWTERAYAEISVHGITHRLPDLPDVERIAHLLYDSLLYDSLLYDSLLYDSLQNAHILEPRACRSDLAG